MTTCHCKQTGKGVQLIKWNKSSGVDTDWISKGALGPLLIALSFYLVQKLKELPY